VMHEDPLKRDLLKIYQHVRSVGRKGSLIIDVLERPCLLQWFNSMK
jgi:hypothetical protein